MAGGNKRNTRQKMINLMYLVFIAMLALNVPTEILDGFDLVNENLQRTLANTEARNKQLYNEIETTYQANTEKTKDAYTKANEVKEKSDALYNYIQSLKVKIVKTTDGVDGDVNELKGRDNLSASAEIMLQDGSASKTEGRKLKTAIEVYRAEIVQRIDDLDKQEIVVNALSTEPSKKAKRENKSWEVAAFDAMPTIATVAFLSEIQSNVRNAEGEALTTLLKSIDIADLRVNDLRAFVVPESKVVMRGASYSADIIVAAVDTTQLPKITVNGQLLPEENNGKYTVGTSRLGVNKIQGHIELMSRDGSSLMRAFEQEFMVIEPMATIAPLLMDVLYANYSNPISISVPGVVEQNVFATATGGSLTKKGKDWVAVPARVGQKMTITVSVREGGRTQVVSNKDFRVRSLPDPAAYIEYTDNNGNPKMFKTGAIPRAALLNAGGIKAAIDDGILNVPFQVLSFRTYSIDAMGNAVPEVTQGGRFSSRQIEQMRKLSRGKTMIIGSIKVQGPDGSTREISPMEVRIN